MVKTIRNLFDIERINNKRQIEFDIAKALMIIIMIVSHILYCVELFLPEFFDKLSLSGFFYFGLAGPFCAPVFMICMGIGISYSKNSDPGSVIKRGFKLLLIALILDIARGFIPALIRYFVCGDIGLIDAFMELTYSDILWFAGLSFLLIGLFKKLKLSNVIIFIISIAMCILATFINHRFSINSVVDHILDYFFYFDEFANFPLFTWFIFPSFGMVFGDIWQHIKDKKKFYLVLSPICFIMPSIYCVLSYLSSFGPCYCDEYFYGMPIWDAFISIILSIGIFGLCYFISVAFKDSKWKITKFLSANINSLYCIHWIILGYIVLIPSVEDFLVDGDFYNYLVFGILIIFISGLIAYLYKSSLTRYKARKLLLKK